MGTNVLGQFLRSICNNSDWKYAVFWKRKYHQNQTILIWEDGYCDNLKPRKSLDNISGNDYVNHTEDHHSPGCGIDIHTSNGCPIELALADMACVHYVMGEGVVGEVAHLGTHFWTSFEDLLAVEHSLQPRGLPNEWLHQIEAGIKTVLLVAVAPYGVLQLGSLEVVVEDTNLPARIRREFCAVQNCFTMFSNSNSTSVAQSTSSLESILQENFDVSAVVTETSPHEINCEMQMSLTPDTGNVMPQFTIEDLLLESEENFLYSLIESYRDGTDIPFSPPGDIKEEEREIYQQHCNSFVGIFDDPSTENMNSDTFEDFIQNFYEADDAGTDQYLTACDRFGIPSAYELCEALISDLQPQTNDDSWKTPLAEFDVFDSDIKLSVPEASEWYSQKSGTNDLFEAIVPSMNDSIKLMSEESSEQFSSFSIGQLLFDKGAFSDDKSDYLWSNVTSVDTPISQGSSSKYSSTTAMETMVGELIKDHLQNAGYGDSKSSKGSKPILRKIKDKPIEKQKRRPRDRQLIQDRLKVLRNLVPNGEKFSIDGLLDRTIKHMMFLRKVSDQSQKLRAYQEVDGEIKLKSSQRKDNVKSGASWAYEVGNEHDAFPIVVEDLDIPGHMLIEMLCNDHDLFLEVAQVICGLELTIVKGGMKTRSSSSWAQFVVEVHKGFQRMDVFWPLMQLLQRNPKLVSR